jgi:hypothetical protein
MRPFTRLACGRAAKSWILSRFASQAVFSLSDTKWPSATHARVPVQPPFVIPDPFAPAFQSSCSDLRELGAMRSLPMPAVGFAPTRRSSPPNPHQATPLQRQEIEPAPDAWNVRMAPLPEHGRRPWNLFPRICTAGRGTVSAAGHFGKIVVRNQDPRMRLECELCALDGDQPKFTPIGTFSLV